MAKLYVDDVNVGVKELYAVLDIDPKSIPGKLERIFEINPDRVRKDEHGNDKTPRRLGLPTKFNVFSKREGKVVTVRYAENTTQTSRKGFVETTYKPAQLYINGREEMVSDDVAYVFMFLHPDCFNSPFRPLDAGFRYVFKDAEAAAKSDLLKDEQEIRAMSLIIGDNAYSMTELRQIAKGMNVPNVDRLSDYEVKNELKKKAKANPNKFFDDARSNSIVFNGLIQDAVDKQIIQLSTANGYKRWYFQGNEVCVIPSGSNEMEALRKAIVEHMDYIPEIITAIEGKSTENELDKPENQHYFEKYRKSGNVTRADVSKNMDLENKDLDESQKHSENIKLLAEQEQEEAAGGKKMHFQRRKLLEKYREEIDAYNASLEPVE